MLQTKLAIVAQSIAMGKLSQYIMATNNNKHYEAQFLQPPLLSSLEYSFIVMGSSISGSVDASHSAESGYLICT